MMGRLRNAKAKLDAINALTPGSRGALQLHDSSYDNAEDEPEDDPPESVRQETYGQPYGQNWAYDPRQSWTPGQSQNSSIMPAYQHNAFAATQNYQYPAQNYGQAPPQGSPSPQGYDDSAHQQYQPQQGAPPQTPMQANSYSGYQNHGYPQSSPSNVGQYPHSPPQSNQGSPPQPTFSALPPHRSATDFYPPQTPQPLYHRSQTLPNHLQVQHYPPAWSSSDHDCAVNQHPILGRCTICQPIPTS